MVAIVRAHSRGILVVDHLVFSFRPSRWKEDAPWKYVKEGESRRVCVHLRLLTWSHWYSNAIMNAFTALIYCTLV